MVQIGEATDDEKPKFASVPKDKSIADITLEEALKLFELPRTIGEYNGKPIIASVGRFGPYIRFDGSKYVSIPAVLSPETITLEEALILIQDKQAADEKKLIKEFDEMPGLQVLNGRYGPYVAYKPKGASKAVNYKLPKGGTAPEDLTLDEVKKLMEEQDAAPKKKRTVRRSAKK